jgi:hypothetical protein
MMWCHSPRRANLSELADQAMADAEKIITKNGEGYVDLIDADRLDYYHRLERERIFPRPAAVVGLFMRKSARAKRRAGGQPAP